MKAIVVPQPGGPEALTLIDRPRPEPTGRDLLVRVGSAGVNRPDVVQRQGRYPLPPGASDILGLEVAGVVESVGPEVVRWAPGDRVMGLVAGGGYAEFALVHEALALPAPAALSITECGAVPETFFTVWSNVFDQGRLKSGETILIHGGASGIGTTAIQLAKAFGATVLTTVGSPAKAEACLALGADVAINYRTDDFVEAVAACTDGRGANLILDMVGGDYVSRNYEAAAIEGRIVQIAALNGRTPPMNLGLMMRKRLTHTGSTLRPRSVEDKAKIARALEQHVWPLLETGRIRPLIDSVYPLDRVAEAHRRMDAGDHVGKMVLTL